MGRRPTAWRLAAPHQYTEMTVGQSPTFKMRTILGPRSGVSYSARLGRPRGIDVSLRLTKSAALYTTSRGLAGRAIHRDTVQGSLHNQ